MRAIDIEVVDDFVSPSYLKAIQDSLTADSFDWHFQASQSLTEWDEYTIQDFGFSHGLLPPWQQNQFVETAPAYFMAPLIYQIKDHIEAQNILRVRLDMTVLHKEGYIHPPHIDVTPPHVAAIVYVNETDGPTVIYDHKGQFGGPFPDQMEIKQTIDPKPGRLVVFDGSYVHTGYSPRAHQSRILINAVFS